MGKSDLKRLVTVDSNQVVRFIGEGILSIQLPGSGCGDVGRIPVDLTPLSKFIEGELFLWGARDGVKVSDYRQTPGRDYVQLRRNLDVLVAPAGRVDDWEYVPLGGILVNKASFEVFYRPQLL